MNGIPGIGGFFKFCPRDGYSDGFINDMPALQILSDVIFSAFNVICLKRHRVVGRIGLFMESVVSLIFQYHSYSL
jgi:hypothetical protein